MKPLLIFAAVFTIATALSTKNANPVAYALPDGADMEVRPIQTSFNCFNDGYYADVDNNCQLFHVCHSSVRADGLKDISQFTFLCGNGKLFNQLTLTCTDPENAIPCREAPNYYSINNRIQAGRPKIYFMKHGNTQWALLPIFNASVYDSYGGYAGFGGSIIDLPTIHERIQANRRDRSENILNESCKC